MPKPKYSFDSKSFDLAEHFLHEGASDQLKNELAQEIQDAVEDWFGAEEERINADVVAQATQS